MSAQPSPPFARRQLGRLLRDLRVRVRMSTEVACDELEISTSRLSRIETGQVAPDVHVARSMLDLYEVGGNEWAEILDQVREAKKKGWWQAYGLSAAGYVGLEAAASSVRDYSMTYVPGLLQTEEYMRAVFAAGFVRRTRDQLENQVAARLRRQERLLDHDRPLELTAIIDEGVLWHPVGGIEAMRRQVRHLAQAATSPNLTIQVIPASVGAHLGMTGSFTVLGFADPDDSDVVYIEHAFGSLRVEKPDEVQRAAEKIAQLHALAHDASESARTFERVAAGL